MNTNIIYDKCLELAKQSPCQKRGFGCVLVKDGQVISETFNGPIDNISHLCEPRCIRLDMKSGSDSMIGDCGHAEEHAIWDCIRKLGSAEDADLFILGIDKSTNLPIENLKFYCVRCSTVMRYAKVTGVFIHHSLGWHYVTTKEAYNTSLEFALKK